MATLFWCYLHAIMHVTPPDYTFFLTYIKSCKLYPSDIRWAAVDSTMHG